MGTHTLASLTAALGESSSRGNVRGIPPASIKSAGPEGEVTLHHREVPDVEAFTPGGRHFLVWYCSGGPDVALNCYATGDAFIDRWVLLNICPRHMDDTQLAPEHQPT